MGGFTIASTALCMLSRCKKTSYTNVSFISRKYNCLLSHRNFGLKKRCLLKIWQK